MSHLNFAHGSIYSEIFGKNDHYFFSQEDQAVKAKEKGNEAFKSKNFKSAVEWYTKAIELSPKSPLFYTNRSNAYFQLKNYEESLHDANRALEIDPQLSKAYFRKGEAIFQLKRYEEAAQAFSQGFILFSISILIYFLF